ncbi:MAG: AarF/ABC1/UbiB kinase family protein [Gordonia sp. (in: high G+C Gram-positive bacteria)]|nr:MAG: AarF/ABC1/UbiB kinase family protein [Gordonia sp. (in: high G+C Gram-positive bacteria)]
MPEEKTPDGFATVRGGRVRRTLPVAGFAARAAGGRILAGLRATAGDADAVDRFHVKTSERYAELLGHSKGVLMKAGQLLSTFDVDVDARGPMATYQQALMRLQADAPPMDSALVAQIVESDLGAPVDDLFADFDADPIAAASIGQVHVAHLRDGRKVAVKVQYPGVARAIRDDLANTELLATVVKLGAAMGPRAMRTNQRAAAAEIAERVAEELDYHREARNITRFHDLFAGHPFIRVPEVVPELCGSQVLTMTFVDGVGWAEAKEADQALRDQWGEAISYFATSAYRHANLFNADPHPGNYRFGADGSVGFVDFGCIKQFPEYVRYGVVALFRATCDGDKERLLELLHTYGFVDPDVDLTADEAYEWWAMSAGPVLAPQPHTYVPSDGTEMMRTWFDSGSLGSTVRKMTIPSDYIMVSRISMGMNSVLSQLHATMDQRDQLDTMDGVAPPRTPLAHQHYDWVCSRKLPFGLDKR